MLLICLGTNEKLSIPEIMKLRVKMRDKNSPKIEKRIYLTHVSGMKLSRDQIIPRSLKFFLLISFPYSGVAGYNIFLTQLRLSLETMSHYLRLFI